MKLRAPNYAEVASTLALVIALSGGTAVAASMINGNRLVNGTVTSAKIQDRGILTRDIRAGAVASGQVRNQSLQLGDFTRSLQSVVKARGYSPWEKIPSGVTVTVTGQEFMSFATGNSVWNIKLPARAWVALTNDAIAWAPDASAVTDDHDPACTGSYSLPSAPAGKVCLYLGYPGNATSMDPYVWALPSLGTQAFYVAIDSDSADSAYFTWAYTAP